MKKAEEASNNKDFLPALLEFWGWNETDLASRFYFFKGSKGEWESFLEHKKTSNINTFFIYAPEIQLSNFSGDGIDLILNPNGLLFSNKNCILFLFSYASSPNSTYFPEFLFYYLSFQKYLGIEIKEFFISWFDKSGKLQLSDYLPTVKKVTKLTLPDYLKISKVLGAPYFGEGLPFEFVEKTLEISDKAEDRREKIFEAVELFKEEFPKRMKLLAELAKRLLDQIPEDLAELSDWHKKISWTNFLSLNSLELNYQNALQLRLFDPDTTLYRQVLKFLYPNCSFLTSSLVGLKGSFELIRELNSSSLPEIPRDDCCWNSFLPFCYSKYFGIEPFQNNSLFSKKGFQKLKQELLEVEWQVYYDFESYTETLTQLSFQIFRDKELYLKENLILEDKEKLEEFEKQIILKLAIPISELNIESLNLLDQKLVYISFNKTFECEWLKKLSHKYKEKEPKLAIFADLIQLLTIDLSDWFRFSKNLSFNLIGPLEGGHSLKKLTKLVAEKKYSEIELVQEGRTAQLLFFYFYLSEDSLDNSLLTPNNWIVKETKSSLLKAQLKEYCELDVENMVLAVNWLEREYQKQEELVNQNSILCFISWFKSRNSSTLSQLIKDYINWKFT